AIKMVEPIEPLQKQPLDGDTDGADDNRRRHQRLPVADVVIFEQQERREGAHHVLGAVSKIDDVEHSEDDRKPEAQQGIERAVDQADQELAEQRWRRNAEDFEHERAPTAQLNKDGLAVLTSPRARAEVGMSAFFALIPGEGASPRV